MIVFKLRLKFSLDEDKTSDDQKQTKHATSPVFLTSNIFASLDIDIFVFSVKSISGHEKAKLSYKRRYKNTNNLHLSTHIRSLIIRVCVYKNGQPMEIGTTSKHGACRERRTHEYGTLTSIPWRSLRKVSTKIARPIKWSWFPKTGPKWKYDTINCREERAGLQMDHRWTTHTYRPQYNSLHLKSWSAQWKWSEKELQTGSELSFTGSQLSNLPGCSLSFVYQTAKPSPWRFFFPDPWILNCTCISQSFK